MIYFFTADRTHVVVGITEEERVCLGSGNPVSVSPAPGFHVTIMSAESDEILEQQVEAMFLSARSDKIN